MRYGDISTFQSGVAVPLFSLHSKTSIGIGEFLDLIPFARWCELCNFNIIQLLLDNWGIEIFESEPFLVERYKYNHMGGANGKKLGTDKLLKKFEK